MNIRGLTIPTHGLIFFVLTRAKPLLYIAEINIYCVIA